MFEKFFPQLLTSQSAFFQNISYVQQKVPTLYTVMSTGENATNPAVYGEFSNSFVLGHNQIIEIVLNNHGKYFPPFCSYLG